MEAANRYSLNASIAFRTLNINRDIRHQNTIRNNKISCMMILIYVNKPRPRCSLTIKKPYIRCDIKATPQSLDWVPKSSSNLIFHRTGILFSFINKKNSSFISWCKNKITKKLKYIVFVLFQFICCCVVGQVGDGEGRKEGPCSWWKLKKSIFFKKIYLFILCCSCFYLIAVALGQMCTCWNVYVLKCVMCLWGLWLLTTIMS